MASDGCQSSSLRHEPQLTPVGEKSLPAKCKPGSLTYCPTMDLIAVVTKDDELCVFRLNGQKVFGGSFKGDPHLDEDDGGGEIRGLTWKNNGTVSFTAMLTYHTSIFLSISFSLTLILTRPSARCRVRGQHRPYH